MQHKDEKTVKLAQTLGAKIKNLRQEKLKCSINQFAHEYDLDVGNTSRVEKGSIDVKFVTLWKISEALNIKLSLLIACLEDELGSEFYFYDV
ncbi:MAG: helix-turn-helix domain-containing protein [Fusobacterium sp.]|nr:helix-turn-helix domain-containing protein [Fusobacterium sp.]